MTQTQIHPSIRRRQRLDRAINRLTRAYKIRRAQGREVRHLIRRIGQLTQAWHQARWEEDHQPI